MQPNNDFCNYQDQVNSSSLSFSNEDALAPNLFDFEIETSSELDFYLHNTITHEYIISVMNALGINTNITPTSQIIPRPMNKFLIFRQRVSNILKLYDTQLNNRQVSQVIGHIWKQQPTSVDQMCQTLSNATLRNHMRVYPDYKYRPKKGIARKSSNKVLNSNVRKQSHDMNDMHNNYYIPEVAFTPINPSYTDSSSSPYLISYGQQQVLPSTSDLQYLMNHMVYYTPNNN